MSVSCAETVRMPTATYARACSELAHLMPPLSSSSSSAPVLNEARLGASADDAAAGGGGAVDVFCARILRNIYGHTR